MTPSRPRDERGRGYEGERHPTPRSGGRWGAGAWGVALALSLVAGCHAKVPRLVAAGEYREAVDRVESSRFEAKRRAARAYATALVETGEYEKARAVLLRDFRHGQRIASLDQLASLEFDTGRPGIAARHWARLMSLDGDYLAGRSEVCSLFVDRARAQLAAGEAIAADQDLRRALELCPPSKDPMASVDLVELAERIRPRARDQARALRAMAPVPSANRADLGADGRVGRRVEALVEAHQRAREAGAPELARWSAAAGVALSPAELIWVLLDEWEGPTRGEFYGEDELSTWLGWGAGAGGLEAALAAMGSLEPSSRAYIELRLRPFVRAAGMEDGRPRVRALVDEASNVPPGLPESAAASRSWKAFALAGDYSAAELQLGAWLRLQMPGRGGAAEVLGPSGESTPSTTASPSAAELSRGAPDRSVSGKASAWWMEVPRTATTRPAMLMLARLKALRGRDYDALRLRLHALGPAVDATASVDLDAETLDAWIRRESRRELSVGHPWSAARIAELLPEGARGGVEATVATAVEWTARLCGDSAGACGLEADRARVTRAAGGEWLGFERLAAQTFPALPGGVTAGCADVAAWFAPGSATPVGRWLRGANGARLENAEFAGELVEALEADIALGCSGRWIAELLYAGLHQPLLTGLAARLSPTTVERSAATLEMESTVALAVGERERAIRLARAAAADSPEPRAVWQRAAMLGYAMGDRDHELMARTVQLEIAEASERAPLLRGLLRLRLEDLERAPLLREGSAASIEAWRYAIDEHLDAWPAEQRASERARIRDLLGWDDRWRRAYRPTPNGEAEVPGQRAVATPADAPPDPEVDARIAALRAEAGFVPLPDPADEALNWLGSQPLRWRARPLGAASADSEGRPTSEPWAARVGFVLTSTLAGRVAALREMLEESRGSERHAVLRRLIVGGGAVLAPERPPERNGEFTGEDLPPRGDVDGGEGSLRREALVPEARWAWRLVLDLPIDPTALELDAD